MSLTVILDWYGTLPPGAKAKLSLHDLHRLSKALSSEAPSPQSEDYKRGYREGWNDREDDLIAGVRRIAPEPEGSPLTVAAPSGGCADGLAQDEPKPHPQKAS